MVRPNPQSCFGTDIRYLIFRYKKRRKQKRKGKKVKKTRITALLLAALTLVPFFAACGEEKSKKEEVTTESALVDDYLDTALPTETYNGETLGFIGGEGTKFVPAEEENGQPVDDALLRRNAKIEERYDVELKYYPTGWGGDTNDMVNTAVLANENIYDLAFGNFKTCGTYFVNNGLIMSTDNIPYLNLEEKWWSQDCMGQLRIHDKTMFLTGMIAFDYTTDGSAIFFNKNIAENKAMDDHFDAVRNYRWTIDLLNENAKLAAHDDNGDTEMTGADTWGISFPNDAGYAFYYGVGVRLMEKDEDDEPYFLSDVTAISTKIDKLNGILSNRRYSVNVTNPDNADCDDLFCKGKALYEYAQAHSGVDMRTKDFYDFGILPLPTWDENQQAYYSYAYTYSGGGIYFPITNQKEELTGVITEALAYQSSVEGGYYYAILEKYIKGRGTYDSDSEEMIDLVLSTKLYDLGLIFDMGLSDVARDCSTGYFGTGNQVNISTAYAGKATAARTALKQVIRAWDRLD